MAVDWSGRAKGAGRHIWWGEAEDGQLVDLRCGRTREQVMEDAAGTDAVVGLDLAFSLPAWFLAEQGLASAEALWAAVADDGEDWLRTCPPPFWGKPGKARPQLDAGRSPRRATERHAAAETGAAPKSAFQIGGAGAVGTGSLRGMPFLARLRAAGAGVWPFDAHGRVVEIWPRSLTGPVAKAQAATRRAYLDRHLPDLPGRYLDLAARSEDTFDAAVSAVRLSLESGLPQPPCHPLAPTEGWIWLGSPPQRATTQRTGGSPDPARSQVSPSSAET